MRCDNLAQCKDHSDETNCEYVKIPKSYNKGLAPLDKKGQNVIYMSAEVISVSGINPMEGKFSASFKWNMRWYDSRVTFLNLNHHSFLNQINANLAERIWLPGKVF